MPEELFNLKGQWFKRKLRNQMKKLLLSLTPTGCFKDRKNNKN